jgi:hypothetical protein
MNASRFVDSKLSSTHDVREIIRREELDQIEFEEVCSARSTNGSEWYDARAARTNGISNSSATKTSPSAIYSVFTVLFISNSSRGLFTILLSVVTRVLNIDFMIGAPVWFGIYVVLTVVLLLTDISKSFHLGFELSLLASYFIAYFILYVFVDNGIVMLSE